MEKFDNILNKKIEMLRERDERSRILFEGKDSEMNENLSERFTNSDGLQLIKINCSIWNNQANRIIVIEGLMDLDYPSEKKNELSRQLNQVDRRYGSIILSNPKIAPPSKPIPPKIKKRILYLIDRDDHIKLIQLLQKQQISLNDEISKEGTAWTTLHFVAKNNSKKSMDICLRWLYQSDASNYQRIVNSKNCEGDTPLLLACMYKSNAVLKILLDYGGADIYLMNQKKLTPYQIALATGSQQTLQMLMKYELKIKRKATLNIQSLKNPLPEMKPKTFQKIYDWLIQCLYFGNPPIQSDNIKQSETDRKMVNKDHISSDVPPIDISWVQPEKIYEKQMPLFSTISQPFLIKQSNVIVGNLLIIFQVLAEHPEVLKRVIYSGESKYYVRFHGKQEQKIVWIDNLFPFLSDSKEPLFLSLDNQLWPMVLQKALCQYYNGYFQPAKIPISDILEAITGNPSFILPLQVQNQSEKQEMKNNLLKIQFNNCILILKAKQDCPLKSQQGRIQCFSLVKILNDKFLINCPFKHSIDTKRQQRYSRDMKLHQAHYNNPSCTTLWLDIDQFFSYFQSIIFCHTLNIFTMKQHRLKISTLQKRLYILLKLEEQSQKDKIFLSFQDQNGKSISPTKCAGWGIYGPNREHVQKVNFQILGQIQISDLSMISEILIFCQFSSENSLDIHPNLISTCRSEYPITSEGLDSTIGDLQFIQCCKKYFNENHQIFEGPIIQQIGHYILIMVRNPQPCYIPLATNITQQNIIEGILLQNQSKLEMFEYDSIYFTVLCDIDVQTIKNIKILSFDSPQKTEAVIKNSQSQSI